jgi:S1-C subfamily serine protease
MESDDSLGDDEPERPLLPPDDRLWRHPSEVADHGLPGLFSPPPGGPARVWPSAFLSGAIGALLVIGMVTAVGGFRTRKIPVRSTERTAVVPVDALSPAANQGDQVVRVANRLRPTLVQVKLDGPSGQWSCSGFLFRSDGFILTTAVGLQDAHHINVTMSDGTSHTARLVGTDPDTAIAVLKIDIDNVTPAALGTATSLQVGLTTIALGMPPSVSVGVISGIGRQVQTKDTPLLLDMIQTDAKVDSVSEGGPLVDGNGAVVGVTVTLDGKSYATPIDVARDVANQLIVSGKVVYVWLGVDGDDLDAATAKSLNLEGGALVQQVHDSSPAEGAGIKPRDIVTSLDGMKVLSMSALKLVLRNYRPGQMVTLKLLRDGKEQTVKATLVERPAKV